LAACAEGSSTHHLHPLMSSTLLALDLSTAHGSIAVVKGEQVVFEAAFISERSHNAQVFAPLGEALEAAGDELEGIVIGTGPGSYTGVRIAIAAAQGVALSRDVWCLGWSSLTAPHLDTPPCYTVLGDARRQSLYLARVEHGRLLPEVHILPPEQARERLDTMEPCLSFDAKPPLEGLPHLQLARPHAAKLALHIQRLAAAERETLTQLTLVPHYLAEAFITVAKKRGMTQKE
jgi:tRNA threonylcarbamoyladenosine biosynthesis protein TsaB